MTRRVVSRLRQLLLRTEQARERFVQAVLAAGSLIDGSFVTLGRKCGKPNCRCATGDKHYSKFVSRREGGRTRLAYVPARDEVDVAAKTDAYRQVRTARAELVKLATQSAKLIDELVEALREPYPSETTKRKTSRKTRRSKRGDGTKG